MTLTILNFINMQKFITVAIAALFSIAAQAQTSSKTLNGPAYENLVISGPVTVELIEADNASVHVDGNHSFVTGVEVTWLKNDVEIRYSPSSAADKGLIRVFVKNLKSIRVHEGAQIATPQPLRSENLLLNVNDESTARIKNYGKIRVFNLGQVKVMRTSSKY
jgi:hypothetical protein